jgi:hypothetical protein
MPTLSKSADKTEWWLPTPIDQLDAFLARLIDRHSGVAHVYELRRNIAYNVQYLQYIDFCLDDLALTSVLRSQSYKAFIVTGISIVEAILYYVIRINGLHRERQWVLLRKTSTNEFLIQNDTVKIENHIYKKVTQPVEEEMNLDSMIKKVEAKKLLGKDKEIYKQLSFLRRLRNKVHLHLVERRLDTDWNNFGVNEYLLMKRVLRSLLLGALFSAEGAQPRIFDFLSTPNSESI